MATSAAPSRLQRKRKNAPDKLSVNETFTALSTDMQEKVRLIIQQLNPKRQRGAQVPSTGEKLQDTVSMDTSTCSFSVLTLDCDPGTLDDDANSSGVVQPPIAPACTMAMSDKQWGDYRRLVSKPVSYHGKVTSMVEEVKLAPLLDRAGGLHNCVVYGESNVIFSVEQSNKSVAIAALSAASRVVMRPNIVIICDKVGNVSQTAEKIQIFLRDDSLHTTVQYFNNTVQPWREFGNDAGRVRDFAEGRVTIVIPYYDKALAQLNAFIEEHNIAGYNVQLDESDKLWTTRPSECTDNMTIREQELYRLLDMNIDHGRALHEGAGNGELGGRVHSINHISATHTATLIWHMMWNVNLEKRNIYAVNIGDIIRDYVVYSDLQPVQDDVGNVFLSSKDVTRQNLHGLQSAKAVALLQQFAGMRKVQSDMDRNKDLFQRRLVQKYNSGRKLGRLLHISLTSKIDATGGAMDQARFVLQHVQDAVVFVVCASGVLRLSAKDGEEKMKISVGESIQMVDEQLGMETPVVVLGYECLKRGVSLRSNNRVITHAIITGTDSMLVADLQQLMMRSGGKSKATLNANGFECVRLLTKLGDYDQLQQLSSYTRVLMDKLVEAPCMPSTLHDVQVPTEFRAVVESKRPHASKKMEREHDRPKVVGEVGPGTARPHTRCGGELNNGQQSVFNALFKLHEGSVDGVITMDMVRQAELYAIVSRNERARLKELRDLGYIDNVGPAAYKITSKGLEYKL